MERQLARLGPYLDIPVIRRIRRNHGLEHATIHMLQRSVPNLRVVGRSDAGGFWLIGNAPTEAVERSLYQALDRMQHGEHELAIHPNCGTNLVAVAGLGTLATLAALFGVRRDRDGIWGRIPLIALGIMLAVVFGGPLGLILQRHVTTLGDPADLEVLAIETRRQRDEISVHRVTTKSS